MLKWRGSFTPDFLRRAEVVFTPRKFLTPARSYGHRLFFLRHGWLLAAYVCIGASLKLPPVSPTSPISLACTRNRLLPALGCM